MLTLLISIEPYVVGASKKDYIIVEPVLSDHINQEIFLALLIAV